MRTELIDKRSRYYYICENQGNRLLVRGGFDLADFSYSDYGTEWLAYKNKEQAEGKENEISKQTAKEILDEISKHYGGAWLIELYKKYGVEVEE